jgi:hypothetical protein
MQMLRAPAVRGARNKRCYFWTCLYLWHAVVAVSDADYDGDDRWLYEEMSPSQLSNKEWEILSLQQADISFVRCDGYRVFKPHKAGPIFH